jgi:lipid-A-disaccharide synthase-like uncharacterized protein
MLDNVNLSEALGFCFKKENRKKYITWALIFAMLSVLFNFVTLIFALSNLKYLTLVSTIFFWLISLFLGITLSGYIISFMRNVFNKNEVLPDFSNFGEYFLNGLKNPQQYLSLA